MATGVEVVLGVRGQEAINKILVSMGKPEVDLNEGAWSYDWETDVGKLPSLVDAHKACLEAFFSNVRPGSDFGTVNHFRADTPEGPRQFAFFWLELFYDPHEMGDTPEFAVFGVALSGRYWPTYLDWRSKHGCIEHVTLDKQTMAMIDKAKEEITKALPQAASFEVMFVERHY